MKRIASSLLTLVVVCAGGAAPVFGEAESNLLKNPSFESGNDAKFIDVWKGEGDCEFREQAYIYGYTLDEHTFPDGRYALKVYSGDADVYQEDIGVQADRDYYVGVHYFHSSLRDAIEKDERSCRAFVRVRWFDQFKHLIRQDFTPTHNGLSTADQWVYQSTVFRSPEGAVTASFHIETDIDVGGGSIFVDDVVFGLKK